ncbi:MAG TPA: AAA family ATPase [Parafilimonas sp.]|nr:AAA family ATPase [Parafilimonas sp.]
MNKDLILKAFSVDNFRIFKDDEFIDFAPLTILTGKNNSGKSSLIKALRLFSSSLKASSGLTLNFDDPDLKLRSFDEVKNNNSSDDLIRFGFQIAGLFNSK